MSSQKNNKILNFFSQPSFWICFSFLIWIVIFRGWLTNKNVLISDALAYYEHFDYYMFNLGRGVFPMWEPTRVVGVPVEFFLRRIGSFNPLIFIILLMMKLGISYKYGYFIFLALYFFLGMIGFYKLAKVILKDAKIAYVAYLLLMFSSLGTRLFDSYILLTFIPMVWFFYFLIAFSQETKKHQLLGLVFCLMLLFTTYIPFYFITIFITFCVCFGVFFFREFPLIIERYRKFINVNKFLVFLCATIFLLSLIPGALFFLDGQKGDIAMPMRNYQYSQQNIATQGLENEGRENVLSVNIKTVTQWGIEEDLAFSEYFGNVKDFNFAIIYIPIFAYIVFLLGMTTRVNRKLLFSFIWLVFVSLISSPKIAAVYQFLYEHIFYYKYFRNLHFFLWFMLLPVFVIFLAEQLRHILNWDFKKKKGMFVRVGFIVLVHLGYLFYLYKEADLTGIIFTTVILSLLFFVLYAFGVFAQRTWLLLSVLTCVICLAPAEVYHYLSMNSVKLVEKDPPYLYYNGKDFLSFQFPKKEPSKPIERLKLPEKGAGSKLSEHQSATKVYMDVKWTAWLRDHVDPNIFEGCYRSKVSLYDKVEWMDDVDFDFKKLENAIIRNDNVAFVSSSEAVREISKSTVLAPHPIFITQSSDEVKLLSNDINDVKFQTHLESAKFLVYNDSYHGGWKAFVDGKKVDLYRANFAFKGVWVPEGDHVVYFKFGETWKYVMNYFYIGLFFVFFGFFVWMWIKEDRRDLGLLKR